MIIIIADAHVNEAQGNHYQFFDMLTALEACDHDLIFLGDIFDLWIALPRYESRIHHRFLNWSVKNRKSAAPSVLSKATTNIFLPMKERISFPGAPLALSGRMSAAPCSATVTRSTVWTATICSLEDCPKTASQNKFCAFFRWVPGLLNTKGPNRTRPRFSKTPSPPGT